MCVRPLLGNVCADIKIEKETDEEEKTEEDEKEEGEEKEEEQEQGEGEEDYEHFRALEEHPDFEDLDEYEKAEARRLYQEDPDQDVNEVIYSVHVPPVAAPAAPAGIMVVDAPTLGVASCPPYGPRHCNPAGRPPLRLDGDPLGGR